MWIWWKVNGKWDIIIRISQWRESNCRINTSIILRTHLVKQMTPRDLRNIHTTGNSFRDALPCTNMALKLHQYFYLLMEKPLGHCFQKSSISLLSGTVQPENTYFCILKVTGQVWESQKRISINTNHSYHQHSSP